MLRFFYMFCLYEKVGKKNNILYDGKVSNDFNFDAVDVGSLFGVCG